MKRRIIQRNDLLYPDLSYQIIGFCYNIYNDLGYGLKEEVYEKALAKSLDDQGIKYKRQLFFPVIYKGQQIGKQYFDLLIDDKIVVELKRANHISKQHIDQLFQYLVSSSYQLGILIYFSTKGILYKRVVNI